MLAYIVRRLGVLAVILFGSSFILFNMAAIAGDPIGELRLSNDPRAQQEIIDLTNRLRLDVPPPLRYFIWLKGVLGVFTGNPDFGLTRDNMSVSHEIASAIPVTIRLVTAATFVAIILGIALGVTSALRQYTRFDYSMTFFAFLLYSLPIFWVAVLLKQFLAIKFNDFLSHSTVHRNSILIFSLMSAIFWGSIFGRARKTFWITFMSAALGTASLLLFMNSLEWYTNPRLGPITVFILSVGIAFGVTHLSVGLSNKTALYASLTMSGLTLVTYFPIQRLFTPNSTFLQMVLLAIITIIVATFVSFFFGRIDRGPLIRTTILTAFLSASLIITDKYMRTWQPYIQEDAINYRPVPTIGQVSDLLPKEDYWIRTLDILIHLFLPTIALTLISFAGYTRFSRGTLLEVLNQDYIRTARAKGLTERTVIMRHAFRNTLIPLTTIIVVDFAGIIGGAIITERVFGWYGMGTLFNRAIQGQDLNLLMGVFFLTASLSVLANLIADLL
ncbi:MAG: ABC transporter permease, partial [Actinobacteria bacterium]|nr:ABC transporter permease [Actinomycetota bacterium]